MKVPIRNNRSNNRLVNQEKLDEREDWYKLVVKIISWKDGLSGNGTVKVTDKISAKEWDTYYKRTVKTNTTYSSQRVLNTLKETQDIIKKHGGFEEAKK